MKFADFQPTILPVLSICLNTQSDQHGRTPDVQPYLDREFKSLGRTPRETSLPDLLVTKATQTGAAIAFIADSTLLDAVGGVGAILPWRNP